MPIFSNNKRRFKYWLSIEDYYKFLLLYEYKYQTKGYDITRVTYINYQTHYQKSQKKKTWLNMSWNRMAID